MIKVHARIHMMGIAHIHVESYRKDSRGTTGIMRYVGRPRLCFDCGFVQLVVMLSWDAAHAAELTRLSPSVLASC